MRWCLLLLFFSLSLHAQQADVQHYQFSLTLSDTTDKIYGTAEITVRFPQQKTMFELDLAGMTVMTITENNQPVRFEQDSSKLRLSILPKGLYTFTIKYEGIPKDGLIISTNKYGHRTFFSDNWPDRAHQWIPCVDNPADKATVDFIITAPAHYQVVANGLKISETSSGQLKTTHYSEKVALPTKVLAVGVADFVIDHSGDVKGIPVYSYVFPEDKQKGFHNYKMAAKILAWFIQQIGPYPYEKLANIQSKTIFGGMENAGAIFYAEESVGSKHIESLLAHEIAHQWFGDAVTETNWQHLWLSEGFATYMTHLYMENKYGKDTLKAGLIADRKKVIAFAKKRQTPVIDTTVKGHYMQLLNINSYEKGGWALHMLRRQLGDSIFWKGIRLYFAAYDGRNANTTDFRKVMENASGQPLAAFFKQWLETAGMPVLDVSYIYEKGTVNIEIKQSQDQLFTFPLEYSVGDDSRVLKVNIQDRITKISVPVSRNPGIIHIDPQVNLLADIHTFDIYNH
jgi:aminopeptidase N